MPRNLIVTSTIIGPPLGGLVAYLVLTGATLFFPTSTVPFDVKGWLQTALLIVPVGYLMGLLPSFVAGLANAFLANRFLSLGVRILLAIPIGIAATLLVFGWLLATAPSYNFLVYALMFCGAGAAGSAFTVWWAAQPRRAERRVPA